MGIRDLKLKEELLAMDFRRTTLQAMIDKCWVNERAAAEARHAAAPAAVSVVNKRSAYQRAKKPAAQVRGAWKAGTGVPKGKTYFACGRDDHLSSCLTAWPGERPAPAVEAAGISAITA